MALILLLLTWVLFPEWPVFAALSFSGAVYAARRWRGDWEEAISCVAFYGALAGATVVWWG